MMALDRRQFLFGAGGLAAAAATMGLTACAPGSSGGSSSGGNAGGAVDLKMAWWGNDVRNKNTQAAIDAYVKANPNVKISPQPGEFASYWDKLATQTAGGQAPDIIQMDMNYIAEYGNRQALLDLSKVDVSKFTEGTVDSGKINDQLVGINAGVNSALIFANPAIFEKAKMDLPDDTTWTWDSMIETSAEVASKAGVPFGVVQVFAGDSMFSAFLRQNGKELFTPDGLGFEPADAQAWFDLMVKAQKAKAIGSPQQISEEGSPSSARRSIRPRWRPARPPCSTTTPTSCRRSPRPPGIELAMLRFPSLTGKATDRKAWYKASMLWSASAKTKNPDAVVALDRLVGELARVRRHQPGRARRAVQHRDPGGDQAEAGQGPSRRWSSTSRTSSPRWPTPRSPRRPAAASSETPCSATQTDVLFGKASTADAAQKFVDEMKSNLQG